MKAGPGACIFCGNGDLSKEDYVPKWLKAYVLPEDWAGIHTVEHSTYDRGRTKRGKAKKGRLQRAPETIQKTLRIVCRHCNGTWMSGLNKATKPLILSYINHGWAVLNKQEATSLSAWATLHVMVREAATDIHAITQIERHDFFSKRIPPDNWSIWIAQLSDGNPVVHSTIGGLRSTLPGKGEEAPFVAHTVAAFIVTGRLIFHCVGTRHAALLSHLRGAYSKAIGFTPIWFDAPLAVSSPIKKLTAAEHLSFLRGAPDHIMKGLVDGFGHKKL